jgi:hypothetical protein
MESSYKTTLPSSELQRPVMALPAEMIRYYLFRDRRLISDNW